MIKKIRAMYLLSVCAVTFTLISAVSAQPGGYQPADVDNAGVGLAADFAVKTLDGRTIRSADLKGKVIVLNFWFIGCPVCRAIKPKLNELQSKFAGNENVVFLAMTADPAGAVRKYLEKEPFGYIQAADAKASLDGFVFSGFPKNIVISKTGEIVYWRSTVHAWDKFESVISIELSK